MCRDRVSGKVGVCFLSFFPILAVFPDRLTAGSKLMDRMSFLGRGLSQTGLRPDLRPAQTVGVEREGFTSHKGQTRAIVKKRAIIFVNER